MERKLKNPWLAMDGYNCIGCCPDNPIGLHLEFYEDGDDIVSHWHPTRNHQSWVNVLHGGVQSLIIDETAGWVVFRKLEVSAVTSKMEVKYIKPVYTTPEAITIRARIAKQMRNVVYVDVEIINPAGDICTTAQVIYFCSTKEKTMAEFGFAGCELADE